MAKILIYGATGGIGEASARALQAQGAALHLVARNADALASLAGELGASATIADLDDETSFARAAEEAAEGGALAGLVFAVGTINLKPLSRLTRADFERDYLVNAVWAAQASLQAVEASILETLTSDDPLRRALAPLANDRLRWVERDMKETEKERAAVEVSWRGFAQRSLIAERLCKAAEVGEQREAGRKELEELLGDVEARRTSLP
jgi:NAD(P)-dependent dehydrogenase (short-subunit alcohol dehydrogenase family)